MFIDNIDHLTILETLWPSFSPEQTIKYINDEKMSARLLKYLTPQTFDKIVNVITKVLETKSTYREAFELFQTFSFAEGCCMLAIGNGIGGTYLSKYTPENFKFVDDIIGISTDFEAYYNYYDLGHFIMFNAVDLMKKTSKVYHATTFNKALTLVLHYVERSVKRYATAFNKCGFPHTIDVEKAIGDVSKFTRKENLNFNDVCAVATMFAVAKNNELLPEFSIA